MKIYKRFIGCSCTSLVLGIFLFFIPSPAIAATYCVANKTDLIDALTASQENETDDVIQIQQGTYNGSFIYVSDEPYGLMIEGGYTEGCASRTVDPAKTVIDAQYEGSPLVVSTPRQVSDIAIEGLTLQNGYVQGDNGGGLFALLLGGSVRIAKCKIIDNALTQLGTSGWGGGVYIKFNDIGSGTVTMTENIIGNNNAREGGGIFIQDSKSVTLTNNTIENNTALYSGGVHISSKIATLINNRIENNTAFFSNGGINIGNSDITLINNVISNNRANGGSGGGVAISSNEVVELRDNIITNNNCAGDQTGGGGVHISALPESVLLVNNIVSRNAAGGTGGGIFVENFRSFNMVNNTIIFNHSNTGGGGVYLKTLLDTDIAEFYNNIIWGNGSPEGKDLSLQNDSDENNIASPVSLFNNNLDQSAEGTYIQILFSIDFSNLNNEDPLFVDAENVDYHLTEDSPCIEKGNNQAPALPARDKDGKPRIVDGDKNLLAIVDIGAYEYGNPRGDLDGDGDVDGDDLIIFTKSYATYVENTGSK